MIFDKTELIESLAVLEEQVKSAKQAYLEASDELSQLEKTVTMLNSDLIFMENHSRVR